MEPAVIPPVTTAFKSLPSCTCQGRGMLGAASRDSDQGEHAIQMAGQCPPPPVLLSARDLDTIDLLVFFYFI